MDVKALAKSKRAHSNHHSKKHNPHQASKAPSIASDSKKPTGGQAKPKTTQSHVAKPLPSNWERYDENLGLVSTEAQPSSSQPTEFVEPKSKGVDYAHLISEAKEQSRSNYSSDVFPSFNDVINDFTQDFGPMLLAAKGQSVLSWVNDDDFEVEGKTSTSIEAPFLSLNLNSLAKQLAKAKLSNRCFLDPDLFPLELLDDEIPQECDEDEHDPQTCTSAAETNSKAALPSYNQEIRKNGEQCSDSSSSAVTMPQIVRVETSKGESKPFKQDNFSPTFQTANVEAELDMLLSSFSETEIIESTQMMKTANVDDDIDKLLEETSNLMNIDTRRVSDEVIATKSKLLDDFDSWLDTI